MSGLPTQDRALAAQAEALVAALGRDAHEAAAEALAALAAVDSAHLRGRLGRLAAALHARMDALPGQAADSVAQTGHATLPGGTEAVQSLDHVTALTEQAAHRSLDLVEQGRALVSCLESSPDHATACAELRGIFNDLALAQGYQDLTGQILKRVRQLMAGVEHSLQALAEGQDSGTVATGPAVPGVDGTRSSQADADDLLAELGI